MIVHILSTKADLARSRAKLNGIIERFLPRQSKPTSLALSELSFFVIGEEHSPI